MIDKQNPVLKKVEKEYVNFLKAAKRNCKGIGSKIIDLPNWELISVSSRSKKTGYPVNSYYYQIEINEKLFKLPADNLSSRTYDESFLAGELIKIAKQMAMTLGGELKIKTIGIRYNDQYNIADQIEFKSAPCPEYKRLVAWLIKHGISLRSDWDVYTVHLFGKRGYYNESGTKHYLCHMPEKCLALLNELKEKVQYGDRLRLSELKELDNIDDLDYSIRYETECYGVRSTYYEITVYYKSRDKVRTVIQLGC